MNDSDELAYMAIYLMLGVTFALSLLLFAHFRKNLKLIYNNTAIASPATKPPLLMRLFSRLNPGQLQDFYIRHRPWLIEEAMPDYSTRDIDDMVRIRDDSDAVRLIVANAYKNNWERVDMLLEQLDSIEQKYEDKEAVTPGTHSGVSYNAVNARRILYRTEADELHAIALRRDRDAIMSSEAYNSFYRYQKHQSLVKTWFALGLVILTPLASLLLFYVTTMLLADQNL